MERHKVSENQRIRSLFVFQYRYLYNILLATRKEKEEQVIKLSEEGKTTREISKVVHNSLKDIGKIIRKESGDTYGNELEKEKKNKRKNKSD